MTQETILVTGGTGMTGGRVVRRLRARGVRVRVASRTSRRRLVRADRGSWDAALAAFVRRAARAGVHRVVLLSGRGEPAAERAERAVRQAAADGGLNCTVLRCSLFVQDVTEGRFAAPLRAGELALPVGGTAEPFLDADDVAEAAVAALLDDGHAGRCYELTGPRSLSFPAAVGELAVLTGRPLAFRTVPAAGRS